MIHDDMRVVGGSNERPNRQQNSSMGLNERIRAYSPPPEHLLNKTGHMLAHEMGEKARRSLHDET